MLNKPQNRESAIKHVVVEWVDDKGQPLGRPATDAEIRQAGERMMLAAARALFPESEVRMVPKANAQAVHAK